MSQVTRNKALVSGATGFVGRHLVRHLISKGWLVDILVRPSSNLKCLGEDLSYGVYVYDGGLDSVHAAIAKGTPDVVFHLATHFVAEHSSSDIDSMLEGNIRFGVQLLQAMSEGGVRTFVNTGTSWQNFNDRSYRPVNLYAATKQAFEDLLAYYTDACGFRAVTLRLFDTYGPDDPRRKLFSALRNIAYTNTPLRMSPGEQKIDLVYIDDVVCACEIAARTAQKMDESGHQIFAVSSANLQSLKSVVETYESVIGKSLNISWGGRDYREREVMEPWGYGTPLVGWVPRVSLEEGIRKMLDHDV